MSTPTRDECMAKAGGVLAAARVSQAETYAVGGARAVAEAAFVPGGKSVEELAAGYERLVQQARERPDAA